MNQEKVLGIVRHVLTIAAGYFIGKGVLPQESANEIIGGVLALIGVIWSIKAKN